MAANNPAAEFTIPQKYITNRKSPIFWVWSHISRYWFFLLSGILGAVANALLASAIPIITGMAFTVVLNPPVDINWLGQLALVLASTELVRGFLQLVRGYSFELIAQRIERNIREELFTNLLGKSMTFHSLQSVGDTMARASNDVREINLLVSPGLNLIFGSVSFLFMPIIIGYHYHPSLIITPVLYLVFYILAIWQYLGSLKPVTDEVRIAFGMMNSRLAEALDGIETVKGMAMEKEEVERFGSNARRYRDAIVRQGEIEARFIPLLVLSIAYATGLFHALYLYQKGILVPGQVISYFGLLLFLEFPTYISLFAYSRISLGLAGARRILELINKENFLDQNVSGYCEPMLGDIEFRGVSSSYDQQYGLVLDNISFKIKPGQLVAVVGETGSGKTTLAKLINRTYDVAQGMVLVDGVDVRDWNLEALRKNISIIEQDIFLFSRSIADNISFGKPEATQEEIIHAARSAQAYEFISASKEGFNSITGDRGVTLSGGQRQRIALARAFLTDPRILILDDSTSSIDSATEDKIQKAIFSAAKGRTTLIITHRLSQIRWADQIILLRKGSIAAIGNHDELIKTSPIYRRIFQRD
jgi:ATP-binding cassette, subfamily B, bacterial